MSSRSLHDMSSRLLQGISSRRLQDVFSVKIFCLLKRLARCLQDVLKKYLQDVFKTSSRRLHVTIFCLPRCLQDVFKTSCDMFWRLSQDLFARRVEKRKIVALKMCWRRLQHVFKFNKCLLGCYSRAIGEQEYSWENTCVAVSF